MKNIILLSNLLITLLIGACSKDQGYPIPCDVAWTSYLSSNEGKVSLSGTSKVNVGDYALFRDASLGAESHEWEISSNAKLLSNPSDPTSVIDGQKTSDDDLYVLFTGSGMVNITLRNYFTSKVVSSTDKFIEAVYQEESGLWLFEATHSVEVYGELAPGYTIHKIDLAGTQTEVLTITGHEDKSQLPITNVILKEGEKLQFVYDEQSDYKSNEQIWTVPQGVAESEDSNIYVFSGITSEDITGFKVKSSRNQVNTYIPATSVIVDIPLSVTVVNSEIKPITSELKQVSEKVFELPVSEEVKTPLAASLPSAFKLTSRSGYGEQKSAFASNVEVVDNKLRITFEDFDNYDVSDLSLNYDATVGSIVAKDGNDNLPSFTASVAPYSLLPSLYFNFTGEGDASNEFIIAQGWTATYIESDKSNEQSYVSRCDKDTRKGVVRFDIQAPPKNTYIPGTEEVETYGAVKITLAKLEPEIEFAAGKTYDFRCQIYVESLIQGIDDPATAETEQAVNKLQLAFDSSTQMQLVDLSQLEKGKWVDYRGSVTLDKDVTASATQIRVRTSDFVGLGAKGVFYIDAISLIEQ